ncbi:MAG: septum site-determining protein MinC [Xanthomonadales bacterium]|nr:septum site-determining protein MinC [Xanthomonadales bacterium]
MAATPEDLFVPASGTAPPALAELRFGAIGVGQLKPLSADPALLFAEIEARVQAAVQLLEFAPVVLDLSALQPLPAVPAMRALLDAVHAGGLRPVGLASADEATAALARELDLPLFAKFRAQREVAAAIAVAAESAVEPAPEAAPTEVAARAPGQHHAEPVRSGQRLYARGTDLTVAAMVGHGAEVIADGSIHLYGVLRGRALAGARGDASARIYCQNFQAELIAIAGQYRVFEEPAADLHGHAVQAWLEGDRLMVAALH